MVRSLFFSCAASILFTAETRAEGSESRLGERAGKRLRSYDSARSFESEPSERVGLPESAEKSDA